MPLAGAGSTSGAVFGSGRGGYGMCGPRGGLCAGVVFRGGAGDEPPSLGLDAIADVDRKLRGRRGSGVTASGAGVLEPAGEVGPSVLAAVLSPLLCADGGFVADLDVDGEGASFCDSDWDRCRSANSDAFFLLS